jgi:GNAT superfamily N-acetyltransferase
VRPAVEIEPLAATDLDDVAEFHRRTVVVAYAGLFPDEAPVPTVGELEADWQRALGSAWVAREEQIVGTVAVRDDEVRRLLVDVTRWGAGIGTALLETAITAIRAAGFPRARLWVLEDNERARRFYEMRGWHLQPDEVLIHRSGVRELQYVLTLRPGLTPFVAAPGDAPNDGAPVRRDRSGVSPR